MRFLKHAFGGLAALCLVILAIAAGGAPTPAAAQACATTTAPNTVGVTANAQLEQLQNICNALAGAGLNIGQIGGVDIDPEEPNRVADDFLAQLVNTRGNGANGFGITAGCRRNDAQTLSDLIWGEAACNSVGSWLSAVRLGGGTSEWGNILSIGDTALDKNTTPPVHLAGLCSESISAVLTEDQSSLSREHCGRRVLLIDAKPTRGESWTYNSATGTLLNTANQSATLVATSSGRFQCLDALTIQTTTAPASGLYLYIRNDSTTGTIRAAYYIPSTGIPTPTLVHNAASAGALCSPSGGTLVAHLSTDPAGSAAIAINLANGHTER